MIGLIIFAVYSISFFGVYRWTQISSNKGGIYEGIPNDRFDVFITIMPVVNSLSAIMVWVGRPPKGSYNINANKFFRIK